MGEEGRVMGCSAHRGHDSFGGQNSKALRVRGSSHYWSAPGRDSMSLSLSLPICQMRIIVPSIPSLM